MLTLVSILLPQETQLLLPAAACFCLLLTACLLSWSWATYIDFGAVAECRPRQTCFEVQPTGQWNPTDMVYG